MRSRPVCPGGSPRTAARPHVESVYDTRQLVGLDALSDIQLSGPAGGVVAETGGRFEPRHEKTGFLHMRKQRRRSASR